MPSELLPTVTNTAGLMVEPCPPDLVVPALEILFQGFDFDQRRERVQELLRRAGAGQLTFEHLLIARTADRGPQPCATVLAALQPGGIALLEHPAVDSSFAPPGALQEAVIDLLLQALAARLDRLGVLFIQTLRHPLEVDAGQRLDRNGFLSQGDLLWMNRPLQNLPVVDLTESLEPVQYSPLLHNRFAALVEETYRGSLDCPELAAVRTGHQALQTHQSVAGGKTDLWRLYAIGGRDAAVLLLAEEPDQSAREIVYVGVAPTARGRGLAKQVIAGALREAQSAGYEWMELATLNANHYANAVYHKLGFLETTRLTVHLRLRLTVKIP